MQIRLGTRASALAQWQAQWVAEQLRRRDVEVEMVLISTSGDKRSEFPGPAPLSGEGIFTKEIQKALLDRRIDLAVHSLKDLPISAVQEDGKRALCLAAVPQRASPCDVLVSPSCPSLDALPPGASGGAGSPRRRAQLLHVRPDLRMKDIRGNVETRIDKLLRGDYDAIILAEAGLRRLGLDRHIAQVLPFDQFLPAPGQGALGLETRADDALAREIVAPLDHAPTHCCALAEREMLSSLGGGCSTPTAALGRIENRRLSLVGRVVGRDGNPRFDCAHELELPQTLTKTADGEEAAVLLGRLAAKTLLDQGAGQWIGLSSPRLPTTSQAANS